VDKKSLVDERIKAIISSRHSNPLLHEAIEYALFPSGKRIRPVFCLLSCEAVSGDFISALDVAVAIEFIHTYSLIHDDIMDEDIERRGKSSLYKKYGIPIAILVGDGFLTLGFEILSDYPEISKKVAVACGIEGMVLGQFEEIVKIQKQEKINLNKTAKLFSVSCVAGGMIGGGTKEEVEALERFGINFGLSFQIKDEIMDGEEGDEKRLYFLLDKAKSSLSIFGERGKGLEDMLHYFE